MNRVFELRSGGVEETWEIGRLIAGVLGPADCLGLVGPLGSGKTNLAKGLALGLGVPDSRLVSSPTFVLVNEYAGRVPVFHLDAYRLTAEAELADLGFDEMLESGGVVIVEWADRVRSAMPDDAIWVDLSILGPRERLIMLRSKGKALAEKLAKLGGTE